MSNFLPHLLTVLEVLGLIAVVCLDLVVCFGMAFLNFAFAFDAPKSEEKTPSILGMILLLVLSSLSIQAASIWYGTHLGKFWLALILGVLTIPAYPFVLFLAAVAEGACGLLRDCWLRKPHLSEVFLFLVITLPMAAVTAVRVAVDLVGLVGWAAAWLTSRVTARLKSWWLRIEAKLWPTCTLSRELQKRRTTGRS